MSHAASGDADAEGDTDLDARDVRALTERMGVARLSGETDLMAAAERHSRLMPDRGSIGH